VLSSSRLERADHTREDGAELTAYDPTILDVTVEEPNPEAMELEEKRRQRTKRKARAGGMGRRRKIVATHVVLLCRGDNISQLDVRCGH
jgi:hypothetical protein